MSEPIIRIFPHSKEHFENPDELRTWLSTTLRLRNGWYRLEKLQGIGIGNNPPGTIVLFRIDQKIVGEAIVKEDVIEIEDKEFEGKITFDPSTVRIYKKPLQIAILGKITNLNLENAKPYYKIEPKLYPYIMQEIIKNGFVE